MNSDPTAEFVSISEELEANDKWTYRCRKVKRAISFDVFSFFGRNNYKNKWVSTSIVHNTGTLPNMDQMLPQRALKQGSISNFSYKKLGQLAGLYSLKMSFRDIFTIYLAELHVYLEVSDPRSLIYFKQSYEEFLTYRFDCTLSRLIMTIVQKFSR